MHAGGGAEPRPRRLYRWFDDEPAWEWFCLLELTRRGTVLARTIEAQTQPGGKLRRLTAYSRCRPEKPLSSTSRPSSNEMSSSATARAQAR